MTLRTATVRKNTNPLTIVKNVMQNALDRFGLPDQESNGHSPHTLTDRVTVILHSTIVGGEWVTYIGPHGVYQAAISRRGKVGKPYAPHPNEATNLKTRFVNVEI